MQLEFSSYDCQASLCFAGVCCALCTDSASVVNALQSWSAPADGASDFTLTVRCENISPDLSPTQFRGMEHFVVARYGENTFLFDLLRRSVTAWLSESAASDPAFWNDRVVPLILGVMGSAVDVLPMHSACVVKDGCGILIAGGSMAGKSTLTVALSQQDYKFLSDDWIYVRRSAGGIAVHGLNAPVKLLADAPTHFPELTHRSAVPTSNGEIGYELRPDTQLGLSTCSSGTPSLILFLERVRNGAPHLVRVRSDYIEQYLHNSVERLPDSQWRIADNRRSLIKSISHLPAWRFRYSGTPQAGARQLTSFVRKAIEVPH